MALLFLLAYKILPGVAVISASWFLWGQPPGWWSYIVTVLAFASLSPSNCIYFGARVCSPDTPVTSENVTSTAAAITAVRVTALSFRNNKRFPAFQLIDRQLLREVSDSHWIKQELADDQITPQGLALLLMYNLCFDELQSRRHHIYQGQLGHSGEMLISSVRAALKDLVELGIKSPKVAEEETAILNKEVGEIG